MPPHHTSEEYAIMQKLECEGPIGKMISNVLSVRDMTPDDLIVALVSPPYSLPLTEQDLVKIVDILNRITLKTKFKRDFGSFKVKTILSLD